MHPWLTFVEGFKGWRANWRKLAGIYLLFYIPLTFMDLLWVSKNVKVDWIQITSGIIHWVCDAVVMVSLIVAVQEQLNTIKHKVVETIKAAFKYLWRYMLTALLYGLMVLSIIILAAVIMSVLFAAFMKMAAINMAILTVAIIALIACIVALVYCVIRFSLAGLISVMEESGPIKSLKASRGLVQKNITPVVGVFFCVFLISALLFLPVMIFNSLIGAREGLATVVLVFYQVLIGTLTVPIWVSVAIVLYKKLKGVVS